MDRGLLRHDGLIHQICILVTLFNSFWSPKCTCPMTDSFVEIWVAPTQRCCLLLEKSCYFFYLVNVFGGAVPCQCVWLRGALSMCLAAQCLVNVFGCAVPCQWIWLCGALSMCLAARCLVNVFGGAVPGSPFMKLVTHALHHKTCVQGPHVYIWLQASNS